MIEEKMKAKRDTKLSAVNNVAIARSAPIKGSVQKMNLVCALIRGQKVSDAMIQLTFSKKSCSYDIKKTLQAAVANAEFNNGMDIDSLYIDNINVGKAMVLRRMMPRARGRSASIKKPFSKITVTLRGA